MSEQKSNCQCQCFCHTQGYAGDISQHRCCIPCTEKIAELQRQVEEAKQELAYETKRFALNVATIEFAKRELVEGLKKSLIHKTFNFEEAKQLIEKHGGKE